LHALVWLMCVVFGVMIEINQAMTDYRSFEVMDIFVNAIGAGTGLVSWHLAMIRWGKRSKLYPGLLRPGFKDSPANPANRKKRASHSERP
ncbi:VanZ family protein, partial [Candidatus Sumerlaeota bacterium]|nr:VanZ family protein [Candidatus Sumerlaeota bacterium]